jgi:hypothetical protein
MEAEAAFSRTLGALGSTGGVGSSHSEIFRMASVVTRNPPSVWKSTRSVSSLSSATVSAILLTQAGSSLTPLLPLPAAVASLSLLFRACLPLPFFLPDGEVAALVGVTGALDSPSILRRAAKVRMVRCTNNTFCRVFSSLANEPVAVPLADVPLEPAAAAAAGAPPEPETLAAGALLLPLPLLL